MCSRSCSCGSNPCTTWQDLGAHCQHEVRPDFGACRTPATLCTDSETFLGVTRGWRDSCGNHWVSCLFFTDEYVLLAPYSMPPGHSLQEVFETCPTRTRSQGRSTTCWSEYVTLLALEPRAVFRASLPRPLPPQPSTRSSGSRWRDRWRTLC